MEYGTCLRRLVLHTAGKKSWIGITCFKKLYKAGGSLKRLKQAEAKLWQGRVDEAIR
jgi:hypothetical protein